MELEKMADKINDLLAGSPDPKATPGILNVLRSEVDEAARLISGVRVDELADENMEDSPIVRLYWTTNAQIWTKVLIMAAQKQSYYQEVKG